MIAYVPHGAAFDDRLTTIAYKLLLYLGGEDVQKHGWWGKWCWESPRDIASEMSTDRHHYDPDTISHARDQLLRCGYIERHEMVILQHYSEGEEERVRKLACYGYRVIVSLNDK